MCSAQGEITTMSAEPPSPSLPPPAAATISKKQRNKEARKAAKAEKAAQRQQPAAASEAEAEEADPFAANYGDVPDEEVQSTAVSGRSWTDVGDLSAAAAAAAAAVGRSVLLRGAAKSVASHGSKLAFVVLRQGMDTAQCVVRAGDPGVSARMVRFAAALSAESVVDVEGVVAVPEKPVTGTTLRHVEVHARRIHCVDRAVPKLPFSLDDAAAPPSEADAEAELDGSGARARVGQDTRLNHRALDLRTPMNQAIFRIQCQVENKFREFLLSKGFVGIHTPKVNAGASEGGAAVFKLQYNGQPACLAQSPQLHKQMAICGGFGRVFEVGPVFRAENSKTHKHLCEFTGLDAEMEIKEHYFEVCDVIDGLFIAIFKHLNENCKKELEEINRQCPFEPLKYLEQTLRLTYEEGILMLKEAGTDVEPMGDLNTEAERKLGRLVREKYGTDFFILHRYPLAVRPFYTMPCSDNQAYSNSFDVFIRGQEIISGAQRIHRPSLLAKRAAECGIDVSTVSDYIESFRYGTPPHGGFGVGLERVVMLFCNLRNIRMASLFPRDPQRLRP